MKIVGKQAPKIEHLDFSIKTGLPAIELHLLGDLGSVSIHDIANMILSKKDLRVVSIHSPLVAGSTGCALEDLSDSALKLNIYETFYLADLIGQAYKTEIPVVVHANSDADELIGRMDMLYGIARELKILKRTFRRAAISVENMMPVLMKNGASRIKTLNNFTFDNVRIVKKLREITGIESIYTTLDICHAMMSINFINKETSKNGEDNMTLETFFKEHENYLNVIHLNNLIGSGLDGWNHSTPFLSSNKDDLSKLDEIVKLIERYAPDAWCVLEINEDDYNKDCTKNKLLTLESINKLGYNYSAYGL